MIRIIFSLLIGSALSIQFLFAQYNVQTCEEAGFTPKLIDMLPLPNGDGTPDTDLLSIYYPSGSTTPNCLVFSETRRNNYVIVPGDWTATPNTTRLTGINKAFHALVKTRGEYDRYGDVTRDWYLLLEGNQFDSDAEAYNIEDNCWMRSILWDAPDGTYKAFEQTIAHESGHCFVMENYSQSRVSPSGVTELARGHHWLDESNAEFMSTFVYPDYNLEWNSARKFDMNDTSFMQAYYAYVVLQHYADKNSVQAVLDDIVEESFYKRANQLIPFYRSADFDEFLHNFYFHHYQANVKDYGTRSKIPKESNVAPDETYFLIPDDPAPIILDSIATEELSIYELLIPEDYDLTLQFPTTTGDEAFYSLISEDRKKVEKWDKQEKFDGKCGRMTSVKILASHLNDHAVEDVEVFYELRERVGCCLPGTIVGINPSDINETYHFDYYIESDLKIEGDDIGEKLKMNYHVNSKDGSMLFLDQFAILNFDKASNNKHDFHAAIWLPSGQLVAYVYDKTAERNRAITIATDQTKSDVFGMRSDRIRDFLNNTRSSSMTPVPLPPGSQWRNRSTGYATLLPDVLGESDMNHMTAYFSDEPSEISSPLPTFGFMAGYIKDHQNRNRLLVYTSTTTADGDIMAVELNKIEKDCRMFNAFGYKPMTLIGDQGRIGSMSQTDRDELVERQQAYQAEFMRLMARLGDCGDNSTCIADIERQMLELQQQRAESIRNLPGNPNYSGSEGTEHENEEMAITNQIYILNAQAIDKKLECAQIEDRLELCVSGGGGSGCLPLYNAWEACKDELEVMRIEMERLQCELAKLKGMEDLMEDCY